jgi:hypothetical protein
VRSVSLLCEAQDLAQHLSYGNVAVECIELCLRGLTAGYVCPKNRGYWYIKLIKSFLTNELSKPSTFCFQPSSLLFALT